MLTQHGTYIYIFRITIFCFLNTVILESKYMNGENGHALAHLFIKSHSLGVQLILGKIPDGDYRAMLCKAAYALIGFGLFGNWAYV